MDSNRPNFVPTDFVIFSITISISVGIGIFYALTGGKQKTTAEYLVGNRKMSIVPVALSLMATFESSIMMLGFPAEIYVYGIMYWLYTFAFTAATLLVVIITIPLVHPLKIKSVYEYLELRYKCRHVRLLGTTIGALHYIFYLGIVLFGPGIALEATTNMPLWVSVVIVGTAAVIYTSIGGIKAVIWTDAFQSVLMFIGIFAVLIQGTMLGGGVTRIFNNNAKNGRLHLFNFDPDPTVRHTFWGLIFGSGLRMTHLSFNQSTVQRVSSIATQQKARRMIYITAAISFVIITLVALEGYVAYGYYSSSGCDPLTSGQITNPNQILPFMVLDIFQNLPGMAGLFMASLFSASLSTLSSGLGSLTAITVEDYIKPSFKTLSDSKLTIIAKIVVPIYGLVAIGISIMIARLQGPVSQIAASILPSFYGPSAGLFLYSVFFPWATTKEYLHLIYPSELDIKETTDSPTSTSYLDLYLYIDDSRHLKSKLYDKRDDFDFPYGVYILKPFGIAVHAVCMVALSTEQSCCLRKYRPVRCLNLTDEGALVGTISSVILTSWLSLGHNFSTSLRKTPWATMPPIDQCPIVQNITLMNFTSTMKYLTSDTTTSLIDVEPQGLDRYYALSYQWIGLVGIIYCIVIAIVTSLIEGLPKSGDVDVRYVLPFFDQFLPFLPSKWRKQFYLGVPFEQRREWLNCVENSTTNHQEELQQVVEITKFQATDNPGVLLLVCEQKEFKETYSHT